MILSLVGVALQITVTVTAPETLTVRQPATVTVRAEVRGPVAPTIRPPRFAPLSGIRVEESTRVGGGGTMSRSLAVVEHKYLVVAQRAGPVVIPPVEANVGPMVGQSGTWMGRSTPPRSARNELRMTATSMPSWSSAPATTGR